MTLTQIAPDFAACGLVDDFADELAAHVRLTDTIVSEGDADVPNGLRIWTQRTIEEQEIYVGVARFWSVGNSLPTIDIGMKGEMKFEAVLMRLYHDEQIAAYRVTQL